MADPENPKTATRCEEIYNLEKGTPLRCEAYSVDPEHVHAATIPAALVSKYGGKTAVRWRGRPATPSTPSPSVPPTDEILPPQ